ncbi:hypothetical protein Tco_0835690 [Tanacetum coccineum]
MEEALAAHEATRAANDLEAENQSHNSSDNDNGNGGDGNGENGNGGNGNPNENNRDVRPVARECTYQDFMKFDYDVHQDGPEEGEMNRGVEKFIGGLPDNIQGNVIAAEPTRLQDAVRIANNLMDQKLKGYTVKNTENKRILEVNQRDNRGQHPPFKRPNVGGQNVARAYTAFNNERKPYNGLLPLCNKCKLHHEGPCTVRCGKCNKVGHLTRQGHYRSDCPMLKDQNHGNKARNKNGVSKARGKAYVLGGGDANPDSNVIMGTFLLNNHYSSMIFNLGADKSFVSTTFSTLLDITLDTLDVSYAIELANGRISETNTILRGFLTSSSAWIGRGEPCKAVSCVNEKIVRIPYGDEVWIVQGDRDGKGEESKLSIISCTKTQKYIERGCLIFMAQVMKKEIEDKSEEKQLEDVLDFTRDIPGMFFQKNLFSLFLPWIIASKTAQS